MKLHIRMDILHFRFNHVKTEAIAAAPLLSKMPVKWIPINASEKTEENIHVGSAKCPWFE